MGHWTMVIHGAGQHHNNMSADAENLLKEFAAKLEEHHTVHSVTFTSGVRDVLATDHSTENVAHQSAEQPA